MLSSIFFLTAFEVICISCSDQSMLELLIVLPTVIDPKQYCTNGWFTYSLTDYFSWQENFGKCKFLPLECTSQVMHWSSDEFFGHGAKIVFGLTLPYSFRVECLYL